MNSKCSWCLLIRLDIYTYIHTYIRTHIQIIFIHAYIHTTNLFPQSSVTTSLRSLILILTIQDLSITLTEPMPALTLVILPQDALVLLPGITYRSHCVLF